MALVELLAPVGLSCSGQAPLRSHSSLQEQSCPHSVTSIAVLPVLLWPGEGDLIILCASSLQGSCCEDLKWLIKISTSTFMGVGIRK